ncbi:glycosyltransferase family 2 protein [Candidatus Saccharibacteria bacterium]|nr:glycosyltransferase family 2 protein [Candidatus Saccharibacteria bacterium]MBI3338050.1 glycosyltransferase family 2 protein [Candidatus Saccharibacteria bacterium]
MKLVIQIPCLNEAKTLSLVLHDIPKKIAGIDTIEILIIDDGSTDDTIKVARQLGINHFVRHTRNMGLGQSFHDGVLKALEMGADIVVNTDGDNQYPSGEIGNLIQPIIEGRADIVVANRQTDRIAHFSPFKKILQKLGSRIVNIAAGTDIPDAASGFRAYSREAIIKLNTITRFSYCMETIIQAGNKQLAITSIPITTNPKTRESRLFKSTREHVFQSAMAIIRAYTMYRPYAVFLSLGGTLLALGLIPFIRYVWFMIDSRPGSHLQSLVLGAILLIGAFLAFVLGVLADLTRTNRILAEDQLELAKRSYLKNQ